MNKNQITRKNTKTSDRFQFGKNWAGFLNALNEDKILLAEESLKEKLSLDSLRGMTFLDIGSGSGVFSLAARRLEARVRSFDYDSQSVACTEKLYEKFFSGDAHWIVEEGSVLDQAYLSQLGKFDIVYSWGVLHHTGNMWEAFENITSLVKENGKLFISIYNDQGFISKYWLFIKKVYNKIPFLRPFLIMLYFPYFVALRWIIRKCKRLPLERGMSYWYDMIDWLGGYPLSVSTVFEGHFCTLFDGFIPAAQAPHF